MKIINAVDLVGTERDVHCPNGGFYSLRLLLKDDGMGFTVTRTTIPKNKPQFWHYKNHKEACYCVSGVGRLTNMSDGEEYLIESDQMYVLDKNDAHTFEALSDEVILICVFNPPLSGREVHDADGSYVI